MNHFLLNFRSFILMTLAICSYQALALEATCLEDLKPGYQVKVRCDGLSYNVSAEPECLAGGCGLIFDVHGWTMDGRTEEKNTGLAALGSKAGYVVVQPNANGASWSNYDYPKVYDFMQQTKEALDIDEKRIHFGGFSQGGIMTWTFLCRYGDELASVAPIAATANLCADDQPIPETSVIFTQGHNDSFFSFRKATEMVDQLVEDYGMDQTSKQAGSRHDITSYRNSNGTEVKFMTHSYRTSLLSGGGHCFPNPPEYSQYGCRGKAAFTLGKEILEFYQNHPKK